MKARFEGKLIILLLRLTPNMDLRYLRTCRLRKHQKIILTFFCFDSSFHKNAPLDRMSTHCALASSISKCNQTAKSDK